jgi:2-oxoglutarate ferredoxin oxidoreductase subunit gamma
LVSQRRDIETHYIPASQIAQEIGNTLVANLVMTGAYVERLHPIASESIEAVLKKTLTGRKEQYLALNLEAFKHGAAVIAKTKEQTA